MLVRCKDTEVKNHRKRTTVGGYRTTSRCQKPPVTVKGEAGNGDSLCQGGQKGNRKVVGVTEYGGAQEKVFNLALHFAEWNGKGAEHNTEEDLLNISAGGGSTRSATSKKPAGDKFHRD